MRGGEPEDQSGFPSPRSYYLVPSTYVLHPQSIPAARSSRPPAPQWDPALLSDLTLTGLASHQLQQLIQTLAPQGDTRRGRPPRLAFDDQVLATVLHLRVNLAAEPLAALIASSRTAIHRTLLKIRQLLEAHGINIPPAATPPATLAILQARVAAQCNNPNSKIKTTG